MANLAQFHQLGPFFYGGNLVTSPKIYHYEVGTTTTKDAWTTYNRSATVAQPLVGDANGIASAYFDGIYKIVIKTSSGVQLYSFDHVDLSSNNLATINVSQFGAVEGGGVSAAAAFQDAVDYAESLVSAFGSLDGYGVGIYVPPGTYLIDSEVTITRHGIAFFSDPGKGAELIGDNIIFNVGDYTHVRRVRYATFQYLNFRCTNSAGVTAAIKLYRTTTSSIKDCRFNDWIIGIDTYRASSPFYRDNRHSNATRTTQATAFLRMQGTDETATTGDTYTPGGGAHISGMEGAGAGISVDTTSALLIMSCDGLYMNDSHWTGCVTSIDIAPDATPANHTIVSIYINPGCYCDEPSAISTTYNVQLRGTVKETITMASAATQRSIYEDIHFSSVFFRGSTVATNNLLIDITDGDNWATTSVRRLRAISLTGCHLSQSTSSNINVRGGAANRVEPYGLNVNGGNIKLGNSSGTGSIGAAINANVESCVISGVSFGAEAGTSDYIVLVSASDAGTADNALPSVLITDNNYSETSPTIEAERISVSSSVGSCISRSGSLYPGQGRDLEQVYKISTTNATTTNIWSFTIPSGANGVVHAYVSGSNADATKSVQYEFSTGFRNNGAASSIDGGAWTTVRSWNPDGIATPPSADLSTDTLRVRVTGVAAENWTWSCRIVMNGSK